MYTVRDTALADRSRHYKKQGRTDYDTDLHKMKRFPVLKKSIFTIRLPSKTILVHISLDTALNYHDNILCSNLESSTCMMSKMTASHVGWESNEMA